MSDTAASPSDLVFRILASDEGRNDPYPLYRELRDTAPIFHDDNLDFWYLTRFEDCRTVLRSNSFGKSPRHERVSFVDGQVREPNPDDVPSMLFQNPPDHTRIRGLVSRAFTPRRMEEMRPQVKALTDELLDEMGGDDVVDLIDRFAFQLPVRVIAALVGVPSEDRDWFRPRTADLVRTLEPTATADEWDAAEKSGREITEYMKDLVAEKRRNPGDDLLTSLVEVEAEGDRLTEGEMISNTVLMFTAGFETTTNLIGNGVLALLHHPDARRQLRERPELWPNAVEEMLRWDGPVQLDGRLCFEDTEIAGETIEAGSQVLTLIGAANRDPESVERPDEFDITRDDIPIMSFASGIHYCLGAALARLEGQVAMQRLFERYPDLEMAVDAPSRKAALTIRGLDHLPVRLQP